MTPDPVLRASIVGLAVRGTGKSTMNVAAAGRMVHALESARGGVVQWSRTLAFQAEDRGFESRRPYSLRSYAERLAARATIGRLRAELQVR